MSRPQSRLRAAADEFGAALKEAFVRHSGSIFVILAIPFGLLVLAYVESGNAPMSEAVPVTMPDPFEPLRSILLIALYGLGGLVFGLFVWIGVPVLIASFFVTLSKTFDQHRDTR